MTTEQLRADRERWNSAHKAGKITWAAYAKRMREINEQHQFWQRKATEAAAERWREERAGEQESLQLE